MPGSSPTLRSVGVCEPRILGAAEALISARSIEERLESAAERLLGLQEKDVYPPALRRQFAAIERDLRARGSIAAWLESATMDEKGRLAKQIHVLALGVAGVSALERRNLDDAE